MTETVVCLHGMWGTGGVWSNFVFYLERHGFELHCPSLRYHGGKNEIDSRLGTTSLLHYADDLEKYIVSLGRPVILLGHSMGGLLSQILSSRGLPIKAQVLITPASPAGIFVLKYSVIKSFWSAITTKGFHNKPIMPTFQEVSYSMMSHIPDDLQRRIYDQFVYESGRAAFEIGFWPLDMSGATWVDETKVICPTLVIAGGKDKITPQSTVAKVANKYRSVSEFKVFDKMSHWMLDGPGWDEVAKTALIWITKNKT